MRRFPTCVSCLLFVALLFVGSSEAILFYSTADPGHNTTQPEGDLIESGWQYQGFWGQFTGTAIASRHFITASHVGGRIGDPFLFEGKEYKTTALYDDPESDLRIWQVCGDFPQDEFGWKLAGINYAVDGPYQTSSTEPEFQAAIFDEGGLYKDGVLTPDLPGNSPGAFYATRISSRLEWIQSIISSPAQATAPVLQSPPRLKGPFADQPQARIDPIERTITLPLPDSHQQFYRLRSCGGAMIIQVPLENGHLIFQYE